ncbi:MAG: glycosyltransferase [Synergistaceae bacterium]|nr:glycosyltransferase [Synergistaceae bacterium]
MSKKLVYLSNCPSHYSLSLSEAFTKIYGDSFKFITTVRLKEGEGLPSYFGDTAELPFVLRAYDSPEAGEEARRMVIDADCVIIGGLPVSDVAERLRAGKLTFMQSERFFKGPLWKDAVRFAKYCLYSGGRSQARDRRAKFYLLCVSAYAARDYSTCGLFRGKSYRWGYFPELKHWDTLPAKDSGSIIWTGRLISWKHPDLAVKLAERLKAQGKTFRLKIIGSGEMQAELSRMVDALNLHDCVELPGALPVGKVRTEMERAEISLFTSDRGEGWGVVLNEAMNSGCAVLADNRAGSTPYLVRDGHNGLTFKGLDDLTQKVSALLDAPERCAELGRNAYKTIAEVWSPDVAARRFVELAEALRTKDSVSLWEDGPGSVAPVI